LISDIENKEKEWKGWYDKEKPESEELPSGYTKLSAFQILLLLRVFRPDRVINGIKRYIIETYGNQNYVQPPTINYDKVFTQSNERSPIVFILSPGADPLSDVQKLGEQLGYSGTKFRYLSLGQGME
jgi:dynein heavy chain